MLAHFQKIPEMFKKIAEKHDRRAKWRKTSHSKKSAMQNWTRQDDDVRVFMLNPPPFLQELCSCTVHEMKRFIYLVVIVISRTIDHLLLICCDPI